MSLNYKKIKAAIACQFRLPNFDYSWIIKPSQYPRGFFNFSGKYSLSNDSARWIICNKDGHIYIGLNTLNRNIFDPIYKNHNFDAPDGRTKAETNIGYVIKHDPEFKTGYFIGNSPPEDFKNARDQIIKLWDAEGIRPESIKNDYRDISLQHSELSTEGMAEIDRLIANNQNFSACLSEDGKLIKLHHHDKAAQTPEPVVSDRMHASNSKPHNPEKNKNAKITAVAVACVAALGMAAYFLNKKQDERKNSTSQGRS